MGGAVTSVCRAVSRAASYLYSGVKKFIKIFVPSSSSYNNERMEYESYSLERRRKQEIQDQAAIEARRRQEVIRQKKMAQLKRERERYLQQLKYEEARKQREREEQIQNERNERARQKRMMEQQIQDIREEKARQAQIRLDQIRKKEAARQQREREQKIKDLQEEEARKRKQQQYFVEEKKYQSYREKKLKEYLIQEDQEQITRQENRKKQESQEKLDEEQKMENLKREKEEEEKIQERIKKQLIEFEAQEEKRKDEIRKSMNLLQKEELEIQERNNKQLIQDKREEMKRLINRMEEKIQDEKERRENKQQMVYELNYQTDDLKDQLENCQMAIKKKMDYKKFQRMISSLEQSKNYYSYQQDIFVQKIKRDFEKYPQIRDDISSSILELKKGFNPDKAKEFLTIVSNVEEKMGSLSTFVAEFEESIQRFYEFKNIMDQQSQEIIFKQIEVGKYLIKDKFEVRENRYKALKQSVTKEGIINLDRLMNKVAALSLSPDSKKIIGNLEEFWDHFDDKTSWEYDIMKKELDTIVDWMYLGRKCELKNIKELLEGEDFNSFPEHKQYQIKVFISNLRRCLFK